MSMYNWKKDPNRIGCYSTITLILIVICIVVYVAKSAVA